MRTTRKTKRTNVRANTRASREICTLAQSLHHFLSAGVCENACACERFRWRCEGAAKTRGASWQQARKLCEGQPLQPHFCVGSRKMRRRRKQTSPASMLAGLKSQLAQAPDIFADRPPLTDAAPQLRSALAPAFHWRCPGNRKTKRTTDPGARRFQAASQFCRTSGCRWQGPCNE